MYGYLSIDLIDDVNWYSRTSSTGNKRSKEIETHQR